jgi:hypothetical protein
MYLMAPPATSAGLGSFAAQVAGWFPGYLLTMATYVSVGLLGATLWSLRRADLASR